MNRFTPLDRWLTHLDHPDASERLRAIQQAGEVGSAQAAPPLRLLALGDPDAAVRLEALTALTALRGESAISTLIKAVLDPEAGIRKTAVEALASYSGEEVAAALASRVDDSAEIAAAALCSLSRIGDDFALRELALMAESGVVTRKLDAIRALGACRNPSAVPKLALYLKVDEKRVRTAVAEALGNFGHASAFTSADARVAAALLRALDDPSPEVREQGAKALRNVKAWETSVPLNAALGDEVEPVRKAALETLTHLAAPTHARMALRALELSSPRLRAGAIRRLQALADPTFYFAIAVSLEDDDPSIRAAAETALRKLSVTPESAHFQQALESEFPRLRANAIRCVTQRRDNTLVPQLLHALKDSDLNVQTAAAKSLGELHVPDACPALCALLEHPSTTFREAVIESLRNLGCRLALPALHERYKTFGGEPDRHLRKRLHAAIEAIAERTEQHRHLPLAASPPELSDTDLPISALGPKKPSRH